MLAPIAQITCSATKVLPPSPRDAERRETEAGRDHEPLDEDQPDAAGRAGIAPSSRRVLRSDHQARACAGEEHEHRRAEVRDPACEEQRRVDVRDPSSGSARRPTVK